METLKVILYLLGGGGLLSFGADMFVTSASQISRRFGISPVIIGLTVVAFGTSAPEMAVNILAATKGSTELAMGNVVGSNIFNVGFILGICALIKPLIVSSQLIKIDIPIMIVTSILLWGIARDGSLSFTDGLILAGGIVFYTFLQIKLAIKGKDADNQYEKEFSSQGKPLVNFLKLIGGLVLLVVGANFFVEGAILTARYMGLSEAVIGLTIVAAGTSLPEVATSVAATLKGERDIAIGNVVGSNIFNILAVLGISALISNNLPVSEHMIKVDVPVMIVFAGFCLPFVIWRKQLERLIGLALFLMWAGYTGYLIIQN